MEQTSIYKCHCCNVSIDQDQEEVNIHDDCVYCCDCFNEQFGLCHSCSIWFPIEETTLFCHELYCIDCLNDIAGRCWGCDALLYRDDLSYSDRHDNSFCSDCFPDDEGNEDNYLNIIEIPFKIEKSNSFFINKFKDCCGLEIECINNDLPKNMFKGKELTELGFNQLGDSSLCRGGVEFSSNVFNGDLLFKKIDGMTKQLNKRRFFINSSCGLHIHIKVSKRIDSLRKIALFYQKYEDFIFKMLPSSRQNNNFCQKIKDKYDLNDLMRINKLILLKEKIYNTKNLHSIKQREKYKYDNSRYSWLNFHSVFYRGTLEIRNHSATLNAEKIKNWFKIHLTILDFIKKLNVETILRLPNDKEFFLSLFNKELRVYIGRRWQKFNPEVFNIEDIFKRLDSAIIENYSYVGRGF